ncbi:MAG: hypothetical protein ACLTKG_00030 [Collinsella intestinalis]
MAWHDTFSDSTWKDLTKAIAAAEDAITAADGDVNTVHGLKAEVARSVAALRLDEEAAPNPGPNPGEDNKPGQPEQPGNPEQPGSPEQPGKPGESERPGATVKPNGGLPQTETTLRWPSSASAWLPQSLSRASRCAAAPSSIV